MSKTFDRRAWRRRTSPKPRKGCAGDGSTSSSAIAPITRERWVRSADDRRSLGRAGFDVNDLPRTRPRRADVRPESKREARRGRRIGKTDAPANVGACVIAAPSEFWQPAGLATYDVSRSRAADEAKHPHVRKFIRGGESRR